LGLGLAVLPAALGLADSVAAVAAMVALPAAVDSVVPAVVPADLRAVHRVDMGEEPQVVSVVVLLAVQNPATEGMLAVELHHPAANSLGDRVSYLVTRIRRAARRKLRSSPRVPKKRNGEIGVGTAWSTRTNCPAMRPRRAVTSSPCASKYHRCVTDGGWTTS